MQSTHAQQTSTTLRLDYDGQEAIQAPAVHPSVVSRGRSVDGTVTVDDIDVEQARRELCGAAGARPTRVLLVDNQRARAREHATVLGRAEIETLVVTTLRSARDLLRAPVPIVDAIVVRHQLGDDTGLELLRSIHPSERPCSVLVIDALPDQTRASDYRALGAHRYVDEPRGPLELIGAVSSTVSDSATWRGAGRPRRVAPEEPPRIHLDPEHAANRLAYVYGLAPIEREVALMVLMGLRDVDIAKRLGRSERTAKRHVGKILEKAEIQNRASLWAVLHHESGGDVPPRARGGTDESGPTGAPHSPAVVSAPVYRGFPGPR